jgi:predicted RNA-binding Zn-ribbon protein involved in translation (DUF1610 family)
MNKNNEKTELEKLKDILRKQRGEIKFLNREVKRLKKMATRYMEIQDVLKDEEITKDMYKKDKKCPDCGKGYLARKDLGIRIFNTCEKCGYAKVEKA